MTQAVAIYAVIVLYRQAPLDSPSVRTLLAAAAAVPPAELILHILLEDNTPGPHPEPALPPGVAYHAAPHNPGLVEPYNAALTAAEALSAPWLLTLDQDTDLPANFLINALPHLRAYAANPQVAALVPHIRDGAKIFSPFRFVAGFWPRVVPLHVSGILPPHVSAPNSASILRVASVRQVGGYDPRFPLGDSDVALYHAFDRAGLRVATAADLLVDHQLSILDRANRISPERYHAMLRDEGLFWDLHMPAAARAERLFRLAGRYAKGLLHREPAAFQQITAAELRYRTLTLRRKRIADATRPEVARPMD